MSDNGARNSQRRSFSRGNEHINTSKLIFGPSRKCFQNLLKPGGQKLSVSRSCRTKCRSSRPGSATAAGKREAMQPPVKRSRRKGRRSSRKSTGDRQASGIIAGGYATATLAALADDSHNYLRSSGGSRSDGLTRNVLSGRLSICSPVFNPS